MSKIVILKSGIKTTLDVNQVKKFSQQSDKIIIELQSGEIIVLSSGEIFSIEIFENNISQFKVSSNDLDDLSQLESYFSSQDSSLWFENKAIVYGGAALVAVGAVAATSSGGSSSLGDITAPSNLTQ
ncbi:hypothetical protein, partial [Acinetobacter sichuanensis]